MKRFLLLVLIILMSAFKSDNFLTKKTSMVILPSSYLSIMGKTNISQFKCDLNISRIDSLVLIEYAKNDENILFKETKLLVHNSCFDCGTKTMNKDFLELLRTPEYPNILLKLKKIDINPNLENQVFAHIDIKVAGVSKPYIAPVNLNQKEILKIYGCLDLKLTDFNIPPPKKMLGLIAVKDEFQISFDLELNKCE